MQLRILFRLSLIICLVLTLFCAGALAFGASSPTYIIVAQTYSVTQDRQRLALIDSQRNLPIRLDFPVPITSPISFSTDGRRAILPTGALNQATFSVWEMATGHVVHLPQAYAECAAFSWLWLADNRHVEFFCRNNTRDTTIGGYYTFDSDSGAVYKIYSNPTTPIYKHWSADAQQVVIADDGRLHIVGVHGDNLQTISPRGRRFSSASWFPDGQTLLATGLSSIERYTLATQTWEVVLSDFQTLAPPEISPDGVWAVMIADDRFKRAYSLHIETGETTL